MEEVIDYKKQYYLDNKDYILNYRKTYVAKNAKHIRSYFKKYNEENSKSYSYQKNKIDNKFAKQEKLINEKKIEYNNLNTY